MVAKKIDLSWIVVSDMKKALNFFTQVLGLKLNSHHEEFSWAELEAPGGGVRLGVAGQSSCGDAEGFTPGKNAVVTFCVDDISAAKANLEGKGVSMHGETVEVPGIVKLQTFSDNDGNLFQLVEELAGRSA